MNLETNIYDTTLCVTFRKYCRPAF